MNLKFVLLAGLLVACSESKETRLQKFLLKGNLEVKEQNLDQAAYYFREALNLDSCFADAANNLGTVYFKTKRYGLALEQYERAIRCRPGFLAAYFNRANTSYELKAYYKTLEDVGRVIREKPDTAIAWFLQGLTHTRLRNFPSALGSFDKAIQLDGRKIEYLVNHATVRYYMKDFDGAERELQEALKVDATEPNIYNALSLIAVEKKDLNKALDWVSKALSRAPGHPYFLNNRGYIYLLQHRPELAVADINQGIGLDPYNGWAYRNKGIYYLQMGDGVSAERLLLQAEKMDSFIDKVYFYLGEAYWMNGKKDLACKSYRESQKRGDHLITPEQIQRCPK